MVLHQVIKRCETLAGVGNHAHTDLQKAARVVIATWRTFSPALKTSKLIVWALQAASQQSNCKLTQIIFDLRGQEALG